MRILGLPASGGLEGASAPQWWEILAAFAPVGTFTAAVVAATIGLWTLRQRAHADRRAEFWRRTEWALEASISLDPQLQAMGTELLATLTRSELVATDEELMFLDAVWLDPIAEAEDAGLDEELSSDPDSDDTGEDGPIPGPREAGE